MNALLAGAGFEILQVRDSTEESLNWLEDRKMRKARPKPLPVTTQILFGNEFEEMMTNQVRGLKERRIRTVSFICEA
jgi:hypothetical protein